jgi:hypothetical protein
LLPVDSLSARLFEQPETAAIPILHGQDYTPIMRNRDNINSAHPVEPHASQHWFCTALIFRPNDFNVIVL